MDKLKALLQMIAAAAKDTSLIKATLGNKRPGGGDAKNIYIKPVVIKNELMLSFVYRNPTNDITKNFSPDQATAEIEKLLKESFFNADVFTIAQTAYFSSDKSGKEKLVLKIAE